MSVAKRPITDRFFEKLTPPTAKGCIEWGGSRNSAGYGVMWVDGRNVMAHRLSWEIQRGPIPAGRYMDHLCRNTCCVNPEHLEPVTPRENVIRSPIAPPAVNARKHTCEEGHPLSGENLDPYMLRTGHRACRQCARRRWMEYYHRKGGSKVMNAKRDQRKREQAICDETHAKREAEAA